MVLHCSDGVRTFHLFNCDKTCNLSQVKSLLDAVEKNVDFKIETVEQHFRKYEMNALVQRMPELKMDYGILVIHTNDSLLFDENGYGEISKSMVQNSGSGQKLITVICGDDSYQDKDEENRAAFSKWAWKKISTQCSKEYLERSQVFLLSWKDKHRQIHEERLLHFLAPDKKAQVFVPQPKEQQRKHPPFLVEDEREELLSGYEKSGVRRRSFSDREGQKRQEWRGDMEEANYGDEKISFSFEK